MTDPSVPSLSPIDPALMARAASSLTGDTMTIPGYFTTRHDDAPKRNPLDGECTCHISPPCSWCTSLDEVETEVYVAGSRLYLRALMQARETGDHGMVTETGRKGNVPAVRAVAVFPDGRIVRSTWWNVDDGSAEAELGQMIAKKRASTATTRPVAAPTPDTSSTSTPNPGPPTETVRFREWDAQGAREFLADTEEPTGASPPLEAVAYWRAANAHAAARVRELADSLSHWRTWAASLMPPGVEAADDVMRGEITLHIDRLTKDRDSWVREARSLSVTMENAMDKVQKQCDVIDYLKSEVDALRAESRTPADPDDCDQETMAPGPIRWRIGGKDCDDVEVTRG